MLDYNGLID